MARLRTIPHRLKAAPTRLASPREGKPSHGGKWLYGRQWRKARRVFLQAHPLCVHCQQEGRVTAATEVDHITPHRGNEAIFWDESRWQALCKMHHSRKTATENCGFGNPARE